MARKNQSTAKSDGGLETTMEQSPTKPTTSDESKMEHLFQQEQLPEPQPFDWMSAWLSEVIGQGVEVAHVFCETDESAVEYAIGSHRVNASIGSRNFIILEIPNDPMDGAGYRVFSRGT